MLEPKECTIFDSSVAMARNTRIWLRRNSMHKLATRDSRIHVLLVITAKFAPITAIVAIASVSVTRVGRGTIAAFLTIVLVGSVTEFCALGMEHVLDVSARVMTVGLALIARLPTARTIAR